MKKVAIFTGLDIRDFGGGEKYAIEMANRMHNIDITFFSYDSQSTHRISGQALRKLTKAKIVYYRARSIPLLEERAPASEVLSKLEPFDTVYNYDPSIITNQMLSTYCQSHGKKYIFGMHDPDPLKEKSIAGTPVKNLLMKLYIPVRNSVFLNLPNIRVVNEHGKENLKRLGYRGRIYCITDFINTDIHPNKIKIAKKMFTVLFAGRLSITHKGIDLLCEIVDRVLEKNNEIQFHIVGAGDNGEAPVRKLAKKYPKNVKWLGFVAEKRLLDEYKSATLFVMPSRFESFGLTLGEAQSCGAIGVAFNINGPREILSNGFQGTLVKPFNTNEFADAILDYYDIWKAGGISLELKKRISKAVLEKFGPKAVLPKVYKMFTEK